MVRESLERLGEQAVELARAYLAAKGGSATLREIMSFVVVAKGVGKVTVPYHWAIYVHDGRKAIDLPRGEHVIFFPDKRDDPRTDGGGNYPLRAAAARKLSHEEFDRFVEINRERALTGQDPIMIVTSHVGPTTPIPFFSQGLAPLGSAASATVPPLFRDHLRSRKLFGVTKGRAEGAI